ncbi:MAG TPA: hypothetical protein VLA98_00135 [Solirubrobacteraceae bacterium]|nr:hypothetical protein [Solirubrobacteraceae bacterium]
MPGIMEGTGAVEVHAEGFRAQRGRPVALVLLPNGNAPQLERVAAAYDAELLRLDGPAALLDHCRSHGLGLADAVVADLLGPGELTRERRVGRRHAALAAAAIAAVLLAVGGLGLALDPGTEHGKVLHGRSGDVRVP